MYVNGGTEEGTGKTDGARLSTSSSSAMMGIKSLRERAHGWFIEHLYDFWGARRERTRWLHKGIERLQEDKGMVWTYLLLMQIVVD